MTIEEFKLKLTQKNLKWQKMNFDQMVEHTKRKRILPKRWLNHYALRQSEYDMLFTYSEESYNYHVNNKLEVSLGSVLEFWKSTKKQ